MAKKQTTDKAYKIPELRNDGGYLRLRNGIWDHIKSGRITSNDLAVYLTIQKFADWNTGICFSNAYSLADAWRDFSNAKNKVEQFQNAMRRLRVSGYIDYPEGGRGHGLSYSILIDKAEPTKGPLAGWRLRLRAGTPGSSDFQNPWYQYISPTPWEECYPVQAVVQAMGQVVDQAIGWRVDTTAGQVMVQAVDTVDDGWLALPLQDIQNIIKTSKTFKTSKTYQDVQCLSNTSDAKFEPPSDYSNQKLISVGIEEEDDDNEPA